jgi:ribosome-binding protein aMBF1 (putative translation factor)
MATTKKKAKIVLGDAGHAEAMKRPAYREAYETRRLIAEVALEVRRLRENAGLTQKQLATAIGSTQPVVARLERGSDQRVPRVDLLRRIAVACGRQVKIVFVHPTIGTRLVEIEGDGHPA